MATTPQAKGKGTVEQAVSADTVEDLRQLKLWEKLRKGELHAITKENVAEFFRVLDQSERGEITTEELRSLRQIPDLNLTEEDIEALVRDGDKDNSGKLSPEELYKALTQGEVAFNMVKRAKVNVRTGNSAERDKLLEWMKEEYETGSALCSLPTSIALFTVFFIMIMKHLDISSAYYCQAGLKAEILGEGFPLGDTNQVHDIPSLWGWMNTSLAAAVFKNDLNAHPYPGRVASYNQIVGGVRLSRANTVPQQCDKSEQLRAMFDPTYGGMCHKASEEEVDVKYLLYQEKRDDIVVQMNELAEANWLSQNSTYLDIGILFLNLPLNSFTSFHMTFSLPSDGYVLITFNMETFQAEPYNDMLWIVPDIIFVLIIIRMLYSEMKELVPACLNGLDGFLDYMGVWNAIDWLSMLLAICVVTQWALLCSSITNDLQQSILKLPMESLNQFIISNQSWFEPDELEAIVQREELKTMIEDVHAKSDSIAGQHWILRQVLFFYSFVLLLKFFKAFRANPRLNIVIQTITHATKDLIHFGLVFFLIFLVFSTAAHTIFGPSMKPFSDQLRSAMMCWRILMGEFDLEEMTLVSITYAYLWFLAFQILVFLILLNMLLAIIMDTYALVKSKYQDPVTIWSQVNQARKTLRETRGHLDLWYLICEFEDDEYPAHPAPKVTSKTLRKAFARDKMTKNNADYILRKTLEYLKEKEGEVEMTITDAIREISKIGVQTLKIADMTETTVDMLKEERKKPQEARFKAIMEGSDPDQVAMRGGGKPAVGQIMPMQMGMMPPPSPGFGMVAHSGNFNQTGGFHNGDSGGAFPAREMTPPSRTNLRTQSRKNSVFGDQPTTGNPVGGIGDMVQMMGQMNATLEQMRMELYSMSANVGQQMEAQRTAAQSRDEWLEQRLNQVERRCEKVERASDRLNNSVQSWDFDEMVQNQRKLLAMQTKANNMSRTGTPASPRAAAGARELRTAGSSELSPQAQKPPGWDPVPDLSRKLDQRMQAIDTQLGQLMAHAEEATESRKLLWRIELGIRQLRGTVASGALGGGPAGAGAGGGPRDAASHPSPKGNGRGPGAPMPTEAGMSFAAAASGAIARQKSTSTRSHASSLRDSDNPDGGHLPGRPPGPQSGDDAAEESAM